MGTKINEAPSSRVHIAAVCASSTHIFSTHKSVRAWAQRACGGQVGNLREVIRYYVGLGYGTWWSGLLASHLTGSTNTFQNTLSPVKPERSKQALGT